MRDSHYDGGLREQANLRAGRLIVPTRASLPNRRVK